MSNYINHCYSKLCKAALVCGLLLISQDVVAVDTILTPFDVHYRVYRNDQHVANTHFKLYQDNGIWVWHMQTKPHGFYTLLTRKRPYSETRMIETAEGIKLSHSLSGNYKDKPAREKSWFDQDEKIVYYTKSKKKRQLALPEEVYDYLSLNLLYPIMKDSEEKEKTLHFYKRGKLYPSTVLFEANIQLDTGDASVLADKLTLRLQDSGDEMVYYYQGHKLAPLKIERIKKKGGSQIMWRID